MCQGDQSHAQVSSNYRASLNYLISLGSGDSLSLDQVCIAHSLLIHESFLSPGSRDPSHFRRSEARVGRFIFSKPEKIPLLMNSLLEVLAAKMLPRKDISAFAKAAWLAHNINAIHPFSDGNGRLSRALVNWVLMKHADLPFSIVMCPSEQQRKDYINAIRASQENNGHTKSLANVIAETTLRSWKAFSHTLLQMERHHADSESARCLRKAREEARSQQGCSICLDDHPNISVLCCGAVFHMHCLSRWLNSGQSGACPQCREPVPSEPRNASGNQRCGYCFPLP